MNAQGPHHPAGLLSLSLSLPPTPWGLWAEGTETKGARQEVLRVRSSLVRRLFFRTAPPRGSSAKSTAQTSLQLCWKPRGSSQPSLSPCLCPEGSWECPCIPSVLPQAWRVWLEGCLGCWFPADLSPALAPGKLSLVGLLSPQAPDRAQEAAEEAAEEVTGPRVEAPSHCLARSMGPRSPGVGGGAWTPPLPDPSGTG